ncbi:TetR/AcrR family transcriptional regulator [Corynebacterium kroppenstedtii]|uniref:TetR/AcrR family transcriptional regulator n=1 Tax=Corynebacterium kroppenstedtii TaxID=161879 RepID=UPI00268A32EA|nr:TetR/AcrR family transcriptional regulator [Corynebacterium kroppenstedtii]
MRADATASRAAIIDAAWQGFATNGPDISLRSIAQDAEVGIATLYRHFPTREDLFIGVGEEMLARITALCDRYIDAPSWNEDPAGTWSDFIADDYELQIGTLAAKMAESIDVSPELHDRIKVLRKQAFSQVEPILERAKNAGRVRPEITTARFQMGVGLLSRPLPEMADKLEPGFSTWLLDTFARGIAP